MDIDPETNYYNCERVASSEYCTLDQYNSFNKADNLRLTVLNQNIRSTNANFDAFVVMLEALWKYPDIIVLTETWVNDVNIDSFVLEGYTAYHTIRVGRRGVG